VKRLVLSLFFVCAFAALTISTAFASPPNLTGTWRVQQTGPNGTMMSTIVLTQNGNTIVGHNAANGNGFSGQFVDDSKINGKWNGPGGAGWLTVYASPNGHSFNGSWGYNGRKENGTFVANKILPPSPITAKGTWNLTGAGGPVMFGGRMACKESGKAVVCVSGGIALNGAFKATDKVRGKWNSTQGSGWFSFWFNGDNNSFNGLWGRGADTSPPIGRFVGQRSLNG